MPRVLEAPAWEHADKQPFLPFYATEQLQRTAQKRRARHRKMDVRPFCAWDGEGVTREDGEHVYTLLAFTKCDHEGNVLKRGSISAKDPYNPLSTQQCFKFILNVAAQNPGTNHVWFAFGYDVNMMLGDLPRDELELLYERGGSWTYCPSIKTHVLFRPKKTFSLRSEMTNARGHVRRVSVTMHDTFTFFQTSFVKAVDTYMGREWADRDLIIAGKSERSTGFGTVDVKEYNYAELRTLCRVMNELRSRLAYVDIHPRDWHGPGAIASKLLQMHDVKSHTAKLPRVIDLPLRHSYAGGRFELFRYGSTRQTCWRYDRRSAYPWAASMLPTAQGKWRHIKGEKVGRALKPFALYKVEWHCEYKNEKYPQPFHHRSQDGRISYPPHVQGWYWGCEVIQAERLPYKQHLVIKEAYEFTPDYDAKPFNFMQEIYDQRRALIAEGHPAQLALKLAINSVYGKLIQQLGWSLDDDGKAKAPAYFNLFWASLITAQTRAALMELVIDNDGYDDVISFETDAVFTSRQWMNVKLSEKLGDWEEATLEDLVYLQSGVYATRNSISHVRGMTKIVWPTDPVATFREMLAKRWEPYEYELTAFVGLGTGLTQDMDKWRHWITLPRKLQTMEPRLGLTKRNHDMLSCECHDDDTAQVDVWHTTRVWPAVYSDKDDMGKRIPMLQRAYEIEWDGPVREIFDPSELGEDVYGEGWA